ncbi:hypothetical protein CN540_31260 [Bacillus toyonensis]|nr:hypothetical protein CN540_31260 [Bacillus toyonensis]
MVKLSAVSFYIEFDIFYYFVDQLEIGSTSYVTFKNMDVMLLRYCVLLPYGIECFCNGPIAVRIMENRIREKT